MARLRPKLAREPGARLFLQPVQDIRVGGRLSGGLYQYTLQSEDLAQLRTWEQKIREALGRLPELVDVNTDAQDKGLQTTLAIDRDAASRMGVTPALIDATLNDSFGQRQVSTIYNPLNQYRVVMEAAPQYAQQAEALRDVYVRAGSAVLPTASNALSAALPATLPTASRPAQAQIPLMAFASYGSNNAPLAVNHQGQFAASTISFNLPSGVSLSQATEAITKMMNTIGVPGSVRGSFQGTAQTFQASLQSQPWLILVALITIYIVLGVLYESYVHPITILSTLPSAGVGAILALMLFRTEFSIMALIGVILLIGIVKKNAIMMIDFALDAERNRGKSSRDAIFEACLIRFRPIMMTTMAALLGAIPLMVGAGDGVRIAPAAGNLHRRRADREPDAYPLHHAGRLFLPRPFPALVSVPMGRKGRTHDLAVEETGGIQRMMKNQCSRSIAVIASVMLFGCTVGPDYKRPPVAVPMAFKELKGWKEAQPRDHEIPQVVEGFQRSSA